MARLRVLRQFHTGPAVVRDLAGPVVRVPIGPRLVVAPFVLITSPQGAHDVLAASSNDTMDKLTPVHRETRLIGDNVFNLPYQEWKPHRRTLQPLFTKRQVATFAGHMAEEADERASGWIEGARLDLGGLCYVGPCGPSMLRRMVLPRGVDVGRVLKAAASESPVEAVQAVARELGAAFDAAAVSFLIADLSGRALVRLAHVPVVRGKADIPTPMGRGERRDLEESATVLPFDGGPAEQAVRTQTVQVLTPDPAQLGDGARGWWRVLAPVTERGESIGLLELYLADEPAPETVAEIGQVAHLLAFVVIANQRHTDLFEWGQRSRSFSLSAEIQQRLLPGPRTCEAAAFTLSGWLEPAASIGGDTFDYSLDRDVLHLSLTDAMGHGVGAALTASLCLGSLRGGRRSGATLLEQATETNKALADQAETRGLDDFVTGLLARVDLHSGTCEMVNAGHVAPYLARAADVTALELPADLPFGLFPDTQYLSTRVTLRSGDRLVLVTDGMLERNLGAADLLAAIADSRELHPRELVRALADSALEATGHQLSDDATILCLDWHGTHDQKRSVVAGADPDRASDPLV